MKQVVTMGLHRDPSSWGLEEEEANRRRLIFWEVFSVSLRSIVNVDQREVLTLLSHRLARSITSVIERSTL